jgi:hypothetical protein
VQLDGLKVDILKQYARDNGIALATKARKAEIVEAIKKHLLSDGS